MFEVVYLLFNPRIAELSIPKRLKLERRSLGKLLELGNLCTLSAYWLLLPKSYTWHFASTGIYHPMLPVLWV